MVEPTAAMLAALELDRTGEGAFDVQRAGIHQRFGGGIAEADGAVRIGGDVEGLAHAVHQFGGNLKATRGGLDQNFLELLRRVEAGIADHEGDARRIGTVVLRRYRAVVGDDAHAAEIHAEHFHDDLGDDGGAALADIGGAGENGDAAVKF